MKRSCLYAALIPVLLCQPVSAAAESAQGLTITQTVQNAEQAEVRYTLTPRSADAPMPDGTENGSWQTLLSGSAVYSLPSIRTADSGKWEYTLTAASDTAYVTPQQLYLTVYQDRNERYCLVKLENGEKADLQFSVRIPGQTTVPADPSPVPASGHTGTPKTDDQTAVTKHFIWMLASAVLCVILTRMAFRRLP